MNKQIKQFYTYFWKVPPRHPFGMFVTLERIENWARRAQQELQAPKQPLSAAWINQMRALYGATHFPERLGRTTTNAFYKKVLAFPDRWLPKHWESLRDWLARR